MIRRRGRYVEVDGEDVKVEVSREKRADDDHFVSYRISIKEDPDKDADVYACGWSFGSEQAAIDSEGRIAGFLKLEDGKDGYRGTVRVLFVQFQDGKEFLDQIQVNDASCSMMLLSELERRAAESSRR